MFHLVINILISYIIYILYLVSMKYYFFNKYSQLGLGCVTVREEEGAALAASRIIGLSDPLVWCKLKTQQLEKYITLIKNDQEIVSKNV